MPCLTVCSDCICSAPSATKPLDRVKWAAYLGAFFNKEYAANALYNEVRRSYTSLRRSALAQRGDPPLVCWVYRDWNNHYAMSYSAYKVEYVTVSDHACCRSRATGRFFVDKANRQAISSSHQTDIQGLRKAAAAN